MVFLFSLINISFTLFFFLFWQYFESSLFWAISILFIVYFSKILSLFLGKQGGDGENEVDERKKTQLLSLAKIIEYIKKWSYYISLSFFYVSVYGFFYWVHLIYGFFAFSDVFHLITLGISFIVTGVFFLSLCKRNETVFLVFRSNAIVSTLVYGLLLLLSFVDYVRPGIFFIVDSFLPIVSLLSVVVLDPFSKKIAQVYSLFLFYLFLVWIFYVSMVFPTTTLWLVFLTVSAFWMVVYTFVFTRISYFERFGKTSRSIGIYLGYIVSCGAVVSVLLGLPSVWYGFVLGVSIGYHYTVHMLFRNPVSYIVFLLSLVFLYIKAFIFFGISSFFAYVVFIFALPYIFIGFDRIIPIKKRTELYMIHTIAISFSILSFVYYLILTDSIGILPLSVILFFESILLFVSYMRLKK